MNETRTCVSWKMPSFKYILSARCKRVLKDPINNSWLFWFDLDLNNGMRVGGYGTGATRMWLEMNHIEVVSLDEPDQVLS